jgi:hypothetical protein
MFIGETLMSVDATIEVVLGRRVRKLAGSSHVRMRCISKKPGDRGSTFPTVCRVPRLPQDEIQKPTVFRINYGLRHQLQQQ